MSNHYVFGGGYDAIPGNSVYPYPNTWYPETETETVVTEFEYDEEGRVKKETRTVTKTVRKNNTYITY